MFEYVAILLLLVVFLVFNTRSSPKKSTKPSGPPAYPNWSIETTRPIPYRPFRFGPDYVVRMGAKSLDLDNWIELDNQWTRYHNEKLARLAQERASHLSKTSPEAFDAASETMELLSDYLVHRYPSLFTYYSDSYGKQCIEIKQTGERYPIQSEDPLKYAALLVQDDLALMLKGSDGQYYLKAGVILIPGLWRLQDKFNMSLAHIHLSGNVPQYQERLHHAMDHYFDKMSVHSSIYRFAYFIQSDGALAWSSLMGPEDTYGSECDHAEKPKLSIEQIHLRTERQTLRRLPRTGAILFTLHPYVTPITDLGEEPGIPGRLASAIRSWPEDVEQYRRSANYKDLVLEYLDRKHQEQLDHGLKYDTTDTYPY